MGDLEEFGPWLGRQLRRRGLSQSEFAEEIQVTRAAVSAWMTGRAQPRMDKIQAIEEVLELPAGSLVTRQDPGTPVEGLTWYHRPAYEDGGREFGNAAAFAFDADLSVLAREATQNSLDERLDEGEPVRVRYTLHELTGERLHSFLEVLRWGDIEPHLQASADADNKVGRVIADGLDDLRNTGRLLLLRIDDYNASGLTGPDYEDGRFAAVVRRQLESRKEGAGAGGSYGLGKATLWAASRLGLVLINSTLSTPYQGHSERRMIGRLELPWRQTAAGQWAGPSWFGEPDPDRDGPTRSWWADEQTTERLHIRRDSGAPGTSFLIVGAHDPSGEADDLESMHAALVKGLVKSFWASMVSTADTRPMLAASVVAKRDGNVVVDEEQIDPYQYEPARTRALRAFLEGTTVERLTSTDDVLLSHVPLHIPALKSKGKAPKVEHRAVLLVTPTDEQDADANQLVCMRSNRMVVMTRPMTDLPLGAPRVQGVLLAGHAAGADSPGADAAEHFLRTAEPPEHNDWKRTDDLTATYARGAATAIRTFRTAMMEEIRRLLRPTEQKSDDGPASLRELLSLEPPSAPRSPGFPTVKHLDGSVDASGAWRVRVEVRLPQRDDPWLLSPTLRFATRSGPKPVAEWAELIPESNCELTEGGHLRFAAGARNAAFRGVSDVSSHPVSARMAAAEVDLRRAKEASA
ncbi:helix-turn-helix transcriptional regulator [Spirillospora sp. NPDC048832]